MKGAQKHLRVNFIMTNMFIKVQNFCGLNNILYNYIADSQCKDAGLST